MEGKEASPSTAPQGSPAQRQAAAPALESARTEPSRVVVRKPAGSASVQELPMKASEPPEAGSARPFGPAVASQRGESGKP